MLITIQCGSSTTASALHALPHCLSKLSKKQSTTDHFLENNANINKSLEEVSVKFHIGLLDWIIALWPGVGIHKALVFLQYLLILEISFKL